MKKTISAILKIIVVVCAIWGVTLSALNTRGFMGGTSVFLYFTVQSNLWIALLDLFALALLNRHLHHRHWYAVLQLVFTVSITLTGVVFCFVLAPTMEAGTAFTLANTLTHVVVPIAAVADFIVRRHRYTFRTSDMFLPTLPALYYLCFASVGYVQEWQFSAGKNFPYFFLDWGSPAGAFGFCDGLPFMGVVYYVIVILIFLIALSRTYMSLCSVRKSRHH